MRLVFVTGMSGAGKGTALRIFEDNGYYCVDNLPIALIGPFADLLYSDQTERDKVAIAVDIRSGEGLADLSIVLKSMEEKRQDYEILFLDCDNESLIKRFKETRRSHPMGGESGYDEEIESEREKLEFLRKQADYIIDTSGLLVRDLRKEIENIFLRDAGYKNLFVTIKSFGFKNGSPSDCDLIFDVRFLPNPYYVPELREKTGEDKEVYDFVMDSPVSKEFVAKLCDLVEFLIPHYIDEGKNKLVIGIGCTGGHHRSVTIAKELYEKLSQADTGVGLRITHRDIAR